MITKRWGLSLALIAAAACQDGARVAAPTDSRGPLPPITKAPGDILGPEAISVPGFNDIAVAFTPTSLILSAGVPYRVTVSGKLQFDPNPAYFACGQPNPTPLPTLVPNPVGPGGLDNFPGKYAVVVGRGTASNPPSSALNLLPHSGSAETVTGFVDGPGVLWVSRPSVLNNACGNPSSPHNPGWIVSGSQQIQAEELDPPSITVDKSHVTVGDTVRAELVIPSWVESYFVLTGWVWVPAPGATGTARFIEGCTRTSTFCRAEVGDSGHFEVRDIGVNGVMFLTARSETIQIGEEELRVELTVTPGIVTPVLIQRFNAVNQTLLFRVGQDLQNAPRTDVVQVRVHAFFSPSGDPAAGAAATLRATPGAGTGGHDHQSNPEIPRPAGTFFRVGDDVSVPNGGTRTEITFTVPPSGDTTLVYRTSGVGGFETLRVDVERGEQQAADDGEVKIAVLGLTTFAASGAGYVFVSSQNHRTGDFFLAPGAIGTMSELWTDFIKRAVEPGHVQYRMNGTVFSVFAAALELGGLYDIHGNWTTPDHYTHRLGTDVDFDDEDVNGQTEVERDPQLMARHCQKFKFAGRAIKCELHGGSHYHAYLAASPR